MGRGVRDYTCKKDIPLQIFTYWPAGTFFWVAKTIRHREIVFLRKKLQMQ